LASTRVLTIAKSPSMAPPDGKPPVSSFRHVRIFRHSFSSPRNNFTGCELKSLAYLSLTDSFIVLAQSLPSSMIKERDERVCSFVVNCASNKQRKKKKTYASEESCYGDRYQVKCNQNYSVLKNRFVAAERRHTR